MSEPAMTGKERVHAALRFRQPDRTPRFIWLGGDVIRRLTAKYGLSPLELEIKLGNDILQAWVSVNGEMERDVPPETEFTDGFGITWKRNGPYNNVIRHPLSGMDARQIEAYPFPNPHNGERYERLEFLISGYGDRYFIGSDVSGVLFEPACHLRGMEEFMLDLGENSEEASLILDKLTEFCIAVSIESLWRGVDWIWMGDDLGSQQGMLMSPSMWRKHFKPRMKRIIDEVRAVRPGVPIAYHSCGSISPIIADLIEIGINVLNPIQESAANMDQAAIKRDFGDRLVLMCGLDTQTFMRTAEPEEIYAKTREITKRLGKGGGYIFAVSHHIQGDIPDAAIEAMLRALPESPDREENPTWKY